MEAMFAAVTAFLEKIHSGLSSLWIWAILPVLFLAYGFIGAVVMWFRNDVGVSQDIRDFRRKSKSAYLARKLHQFTQWTAVATIVLFLCPSFIYLNLKHESLVYALMDNTGTLSSMVIGLTTIVLTVTVVIVIFNKNYYLVFTISDVLKSYHFTGCMGALLASCVGTCICCLLLLWIESGTIWSKSVLLVLEGCILVNLMAVALSFHIIYSVMFSGRKVELRQLDRLYRIFRGEELPEEAQGLQAEQWDWPAVRMNVEYLCAGYLTAARKVPIHEVKRLRYLVGDNRETVFGRWYRVLLSLFVGGAAVAWAISMSVILVNLRADGVELAALDTGLFILCFLPLCCFHKKIKNALYELFIDSLGYTMNIGKRQVLILRYSFGPVNRFDRFIRRMNSLTAFFAVAIQKGVRRELVEKGLEVVIDWMGDVRERHESLYLPVFAIGYFAFENDMRFPAVRECYRMLREEPVPALPDWQNPAQVIRQAGGPLTEESQDAGEKGGVPSPDELRERLEEAERDVKVSMDELHGRLDEAEKDAKVSMDELHERLEEAERDAKTPLDKLHAAEREARASVDELHERLEEAERDAKTPLDKLHAAERDARASVDEMHERLEEAERDGKTPLDKLHSRLDAGVDAILQKGRPLKEESLEEYLAGVYKSMEDLLPGSRNLMEKLVSPRVVTDDEDFDAMLAGHLLDLTQDTVGQNAEVVSSIAEYLNWLHGIDRTAV